MSEELYEEISQKANASGIDPVVLRDEFNKEHRHLQNEIFFNLVLPLVEEMAEQGTDARNARAQEQARRLLE